MSRRIHPKMSTWIQLFCPCKFIIYVHKKSATHLGHSEKVFWGSAVGIFAVYTSTFVLRQEKLSCLTPLSVLTDVVKVKSLANFKRLEKGLLSSTKKKVSQGYISYPYLIHQNSFAELFWVLTSWFKMGKKSKRNQNNYFLMFLFLLFGWKTDCTLERLNCVRILFSVSISAA